MYYPPLRERRCYFAFVALMRGVLTACAQGRIAEQGALTWVLHSQASKWKDRVLLERNFTMNGNWMDYAGKWVKGAKRLSQSVWGNDQVPFVVQYAGCQVLASIPTLAKAAGSECARSDALACRCAAGTRRTARGTMLA